MALIGQAVTLATKVASNHGWGGNANGWWSNGSTHFAHPDADRKGLSIWPWRGGDPVHIDGSNVAAPILMGEQIGWCDGQATAMADLSGNIFHAYTYPPHSSTGGGGFGYAPANLIPLPQWDTFLIYLLDYYGANNGYFMGGSLQSEIIAGNGIAAIQYLWETSQGYSFYAFPSYVDSAGQTQALRLDSSAHVASAGAAGFVTTGGRVKYQSSRWQEYFGYASWPNPTYAIMDPNTQSVPGVFFTDNFARTPSFTTAPIVGPGAFLLVNADASLLFWSDAGGSIGISRKGDTGPVHYGTLPYPIRLGYNATIVDADLNRDGTEGLVVVSNPGPFRSGTTVYDTWHFDLSLHGFSDLVGPDGVYIDPDTRRFRNSAAVTSTGFSRW